ncbi:MULTISPECIES: hypothetical protein [Enterococcus]|uniref:Uncharacterized protein n=1 Tax=Candidatus Enterococcus mangumiae TaxID=2230878 RepID=A0ABZ2SSV3_9ENTE|nr:MULTISPECIES: hypothetical protein [unclassified Enterococcus]MBO0462798.1 hypothetical protein [Enterococcus sp. DIV1298c]MBO0491383.1 hypothetical protein [Enterococcus sp. DIV1094]MBO1301110.1 hypothetical protein [Enterococcus sp. DIV1271a]
MHTANTQDYCACTTPQNVHTEINDQGRANFCDHCHKMIEGSNQPFDFSIKEEEAHKETRK